MSGATGDVSRVVSVSREMTASPAAIFELIADPGQQPRWDANDNLVEAAPGQRVRQVGDVFLMKIHTGDFRENHVVEFAEGRRIAWQPAEVGQPQPCHRWGWELTPLDGGRTRVTHTYDWTRLEPGPRVVRARATTPDKLQASLDRLATLVERAG